ncbi:uncharacterized protein YALI1_B09591g [Yarrowia lipolytica]|uniref:Uncharacterized protein n=1 Tax=Yarrowia lipolytica TaxID=4952 RepID=A0A1D8N6V4_YARLL|nr:hypothetical protein YALI1_B09591g [Yarrowia lipolytica]
MWRMWRKPAFLFIRGSCFCVAAVCVCCFSVCLFRPACVCSVLSQGFAVKKINSGRVRTSRLFHTWGNHVMLNQWQTEAKSRPNRGLNTSTNPSAGERKGSVSRDRLVFMFFLFFMFFCVFSCRRPFFAGLASAVGCSPRSISGVKTAARWLSQKN